MKKRIHYGFGKEYLKSWKLQEALREIYQNFIDYGQYEENIEYDYQNNRVYVDISNDWIPENLNFLRIGNSKKSNEESVGKHGEGLKMAFLIFLRDNFDSFISTSKYYITPEFVSEEAIGECFSLVYEEHSNEIVKDKFTIGFECPIEVFENFKKNLILDSDVIFNDHYYGQIVDKPKGNVYSGRLFVAHIDGLTNSYNIRPTHLTLDRDRSVPRSFDVNYASSKIFEAYGKLSIKDLSHSDTMYMTKVPKEIINQFEPKIVGTEIEFVAKHEDTNEEIIVSNTNIKEALKADSFFSAQIKKLKMFLAKKLGLYELLMEFKNKHVHTAEARSDFEVILEKIK